MVYIYYHRVQILFDRHKLLLYVDLRNAQDDNNIDNGGDKQQQQHSVLNKTIDGRCRERSSKNSLPLLYSSSRSIVVSRLAAVVISSQIVCVQ